MSVANNVAKAQIIENYQLFAGDTGSSSVQIALLTHRIKSLTNHLRLHPKDRHTAYGLKKLVSQRRKLMRYFKQVSPQQYSALIEKLDLRDIRS